MFTGTYAAPGGYRTTVFGIDLDDGSVVWRNEEFEDDYWIDNITRRGGECVLAGVDDSYQGYVAGVSVDGTKGWETVLEEYDAGGVRDLSSSEDSTAILGRRSQDNRIHAISLTSDGSQRWGIDLSVPDVGDVSASEITPAESGGWLAVATYESRPDLYVARLTDSGEKAEGYFVNGWNRTATLGEASSKDDTVFIAGETSNGQDEQTQTWAAKLSPREPTATPTAVPTPQHSPTQTPQPPSSPTPQSSPNQGTSTGTATPTPPQKQTDGQTTTIPETTEQDGPGFGIAGMILSVLSLGAFERYRDSSSSE